MNLVIVESPAKAKTINKYLGNKFKVIASFGHIRDLPSKNGSVEPDKDFQMHYEISAKSQKHVKQIAENAKNTKVIYLATDPDREGEAISWHIVEALKKQKKIKKDTVIHRVVFHEITKKAVTDAINNPRDINMDLVNAQQARRALDYLVGFTLSPLLWHKLPGSRSAGRVQSVALKLICEREFEIRSFRAQEYWSILLRFMTLKNEIFIAKLFSIDGKKLDKLEINNEKNAKEIAHNLAAHNYAVEKVEKKQTKRNPQPPFTTSSLQQEASRKLGFSAKQTMMTAQKLYEGVDVQGETVGLITYMRTDSVIVSQEALKNCRDLINNIYGKKYLPATPRAFQSKAKNAQEAHEAIRPTSFEYAPDKIESSLNPDQFRLYKLIWERMLASQMESAIINQVSVDIKSDNGKYLIRANGSNIHFDGFYRIYKEGIDDASQDDEENEDKLLPVLNEKDKLNLSNIDPKQHFTQAAPRFSEASMVKKLEELGIGRPSTYANILSVLQERNYVKLDKKRFIAEDRGIIVTSFLNSYFEKYVEYNFTASLEEELDDISNGKIDWKIVLKNFWEDFNRNVKNVSEYSVGDIINQLNQLLGDYLFPKDKDGEINRNCPLCKDGELSLKLGKFGAFLGCSNYPVCSYTKQLSSEEAIEGEENSEAKGDKILGKDSDTGADIILKQGPYGFYVETEDPGNKKPKRASIPKNMNVQEVTLEQAQALLSLPRVIGDHPEDYQEIITSIGKFGPYLKHNGKFYSLKEDDPLTIGINRAVAIIADNQNGKKSASGPIKELGEYKKKGSVNIYSGKYGPYIKLKTKNYKLPKNIDIEKLTLEEAVKIIENSDKNK